MKARFLIRRGDEELRAETLQDFEAMVRSGAILPDDLVHDSMTGEWAPARTHPAYRVVADALEEEGLWGEDDAPLSMDLVEEERASPEEEAQAFIERMEREREEEHARKRGPSRDPEVFDVSTADSLARPLDDDVDDGLDDERERDWSTPERRGPATAGSPVAWDGPSESSNGGRRRALGMVGVALLALGVTAAVAHPAFRFPDTFPGIRSAPAEEELALPPEPEPTEPRPADAAPATDAELRSLAWDGFVERVDSVREAFELGRVPPVWLEGRYLAEASSHPEVEEFWTEYLRYVERVYAEEENLFRDAYLEVLQESGMTGPVRSLRLARVTEDFRAGATERRALYSGVWQLAVTARSLHQVLVELEGDITWEPAVSGRLSADPVVEAAGRSEEAQARLDGALDRVLAAMYEVTDGGRNVRGQRPDWLARALAAGGWTAP